MDSSRKVRGISVDLQVCVKREQNCSPAISILTILANNSTDLHLPKASKVFIFRPVGLHLCEVLSKLKEISEHNGGESSEVSMCQALQHLTPLL